MTVGTTWLGGWVEDKRIANNYRQNCLARHLCCPTENPVPHISCSPLFLRKSTHFKYATKHDECSVFASEAPGGAHLHHLSAAQTLLSASSHANTSITFRYAPQNPSPAALEPPWAPSGTRNFVFSDPNSAKYLVTELVHRRKSLPSYTQHTRTPQLA